VTQPVNGTVVITGGGTGLTYAPNADYCNTPPGTTKDTFTYTVNGNSANKTATVSMTVRITLIARLLPALSRIEGTSTRSAHRR